MRFIKDATLLLLTALCLSQVVYGQTNRSTFKGAQRIDITKLEIRDSVLITQLKKFIKTQSEEDSLFKKKGYVQVFLTNIPHKPNVVRSYHINKNYISFDDMDNDKQFPLFYSLLSNRVVLFMYYDLSDIFKLRFTRKSKSKFRKDLEPYLFKSRTVMLPNEYNKMTKARNFRPDEVIHAGGGIDVYIMNDGSIIVE